MGMKKMNKKVKKKWTTALRSGQYDQIQGTLCAETVSSGRTGFCCLGVLCNIHAEESGGGWEESNEFKSRSKFVGSKGKVKKIMSKGGIVVCNQSSASEEMQSLPVMSFVEGTYNVPGTYLYSPIGLCNMWTNFSDEEQTT